MKKLLLVVIALFATFLWAQTSSSGSTQDQKTTDQGTKKSTHKKGETTLTGCLGGSEGNYTLKHGKREVAVTSSEDLSKHVGHEVKLHGSWAKAGEEAGAAAGMEKGTEAKKGAAGKRTFNATSIDHISDTCPAAGAATEKGEKGEMGEHMHHKGAAAPSGSPAASPSPSPQK